MLRVAQDLPVCGETFASLRADTTMREGRKRASKTDSSTLEGFICRRSLKQQGETFGSDKPV